MVQYLALPCTLRDNVTMLWSTKRINFTMTHALYLSGRGYDCPSWTKINVSEEMWLSTYLTTSRDTAQHPDTSRDVPPRVEMCPNACRNISRRLDTSRDISRCRHTLFLPSTLLTRLHLEIPRYISRCLEMFPAIPTHLKPFLAPIQLCTSHHISRCLEMS